MKLLIRAGRWPAILSCCAASLLSTPAAAQPWEVAHFSTEAKALHAQASAASAPEGSDAVVLDDEESYVFDAQGGTVHTTYVVYKVLSQGGVEDWSSLGVDWEPWHQDRPRIRARVIRPDGKVYELEEKAIADTPAAQGSADVYSDRRVLRAPLPAVAPGSVVEEEIVQGSRPLLAGSGTAGRFFFGRWVPVQHTQLTLEAPPALPLRYRMSLLPAVQPKVDETPQRRRWVFESGPLAALEAVDPDLPPDVAALPHVDLSSTPDWATLAQRYGEIVDQRIGQADVGAQTAKLVQGLAEREARIAAISGFLNREIRYTGVEFGEAAIVPRTPAEVLGSKYGDCKDKAALLVAMLRSAGIPAYLALLNAGSREDLAPEIPGPDFFDHAIVYVPGEQPLWIDATAQYARLGHLPGGDQGRYALVVQPGTTALQRIPESPPLDNLLVEERELDLAEYGAARVVETSHPHGSFDSMYRSAYADARSKEVHKSLAEYMKKQYLADNLDRLDSSQADDLGTEYRLELESKQARRGYTDLDAAAAYIRPETLFASLPSELQDRQDDKAKDANGQPKKKRSADYYLRMPYVDEWHYRIVPPAGFVAQALPQDSTVELGPARLSEHFSLDAGGVVHADLRFDTVKRRYSPAEAEALSARVADISDGPAIAVRFEPAATALMRQSKWNEAFQSYRDLIAANPGSAVQHLRRAYALLDAGFGEAARAEARQAVKLDPKSALAQAALGYVLEHDLVGRQWRRGADLAGAAVAMRAATGLEPDAAEHHGNLAVLLEYNGEGQRYGDGADLAGASAEYAKITPAQLKDIGFTNNPPYPLFYAGRFAEAKKMVDELNEPPQGLLIACEAALNGAPAAISRAQGLAGGDEHVKAVLRTAGDMLEKVRLYAPAADLLEAGASGDGAVRTMNAAAILRKLQRHESLHFDDTPEGTVVRWAAAILDEKRPAADFEAMPSRNNLAAEGDMTAADYGRGIVTQRRAIIGRSEFSAGVLADLLTQSANHQVEGNDAAAYRVSLAGAFSSSGSVYYVVRESGHYRILAAQPELTPLALEALDRIAAGDLASARLLLDWIRDQQHLAGGDDPLSGNAFPRLWNRGQEADAQRMTLAAAAALVQHEKTARRGVALLQAAGDGLSPADRSSVDLALLVGYGWQRDYAHVLEAATRLTQAYPQSDRAFRARGQALRGLGRLDEADQLARQRQAQDPDSTAAALELEHSQQQRGDYAGAFEALRPLIERGKGGSLELNDLAWDSLFFARSGGADVADAERAAQLAPHSFAVLQTLASVYAEAGQIKQAREILLQAMEAQHQDEPSPDIWYVVGRLAEQYGERELALDCYRRIPAPDAGMPDAASSYVLTQMRLAALRKAPAQAGAAPATHSAS